MTLTEEKRNLFDYVSNKDYRFAHCISADYAMGAGIAVDFKKIFKLQNRVKEAGSGTFPEVIYTEPVYNLVTKSKYWNKPTYGSLSLCLIKLRNIVPAGTTIVMPRIGCGLDKLKWAKVRELINEIFDGVDINFIVCRL